MFFRSPRGFNFSRTYLPLPTERTVQRILSEYPLQEGIDEVAIQMLGKVVENWTADERLLGQYAVFSDLKTTLFFH